MDDANSMIQYIYYEVRACRGQAMILTVLVLGGAILGATTIAGLLTVYQVRQTADFANSAKAIFAADAGIEWGLYQFFRTDGTETAPVLSNGANFRLACADLANEAVDCTNSSTASIRAVGTSGQSSRALRLSL